MGRVLCVDQKLSDSERMAAEKYYYLLSFYIRKKRLNEKEWRSELHIPYLQGIQVYFANAELQKYSIKTIIWRTMDNYRIAWYRKQKRKKRNPAGGLCSYENLEEYILYLYGVQESFGSHCKSLERRVIEKIMLENVISCIEDEKQREIVKMLSMGYKKCEIKRTLDLSYYRLTKYIKDIRRVVNGIIYGEGEKRNIEI